MDRRFKTKINQYYCGLGVTVYEIMLRLPKQKTTQVGKKDVWQLRAQWSGNRREDTDQGFTIGHAQTITQVSLLGSPDI